jgi:excinuclease ABC subunit C
MPSASCSAGQQDVIADLQAHMLALSEALDFEKAAEVRDRIGALSRVLQQQSVDESSLSSGERDVDILAVKVAGGRACVNLAMVRGSRHLGDRAFFPAHVADAAADVAGTMPPQATTAPGDAPAAEADAEPAAASVEVAVLEAFIAQHYPGQVVPPLLVTSHAVDPQLLAALAQAAGQRVRAVHQPREQRRIWLEMAVKGAELALARLLAEEGLPARAHASADRGAGSGHR